MLIPADLQVEETRILETIRRAESVGLYETKRRRKDGTSVEVSLSISPLKNARGEIVGASKIARDITARKLAEGRLHESEKQLRQTIMNVAVPTLLYADDDTILLVNQAWTDITGYRIADIPSISDWTQKAYGERKALAKEYIDALFETETRLDNGEWNVTTATGETRVWHFSSTPLGREPGGRRLMVSTAIDITRRKQMEQELQTTNHQLLSSSEELKRQNEELRVMAEELRQNTDQLEARVAQRTSQLRALAADLTQTEERERRRIAQLLHDGLQQLLVGATVHLEILRKQKDPRSRLETLQRVEQLIQESNDVARDLSHELSPIALQQGNLAGALKWLAGWMDRNHRLTVRIEGEAIAAPVEDSVKVMLFQSVRELLLNVVKHAGVKRARVRMTETREGQLEILVNDQGKGFDAERTTAGGETSSGLGLFSIRERLHLLGGRMEVQSASGRGSQFRLLAPLQKPAQSNAAPKAPLPAPRAKARPSSAKIARAGQSRIRVVLADDHKVMRDGLTALLAQQSGIEVVGVASNGQEVIKQASKLQPDLVIMNINMPRMNGIQATQEITAAWPGIKVIGLTMHADTLRREAMLKAGAVDCLSKSSLSRDLIKTIHAAVTSATTRSDKRFAKKPVRARAGQV